MRLGSQSSHNQKRVIPTEAGRAPGAACAAEGSWQHVNPAQLDGTKPPTDPPVIPNAHMNLSSIAASWHPTFNQSKNVPSRPKQAALPARPAQRRDRGNTPTQRTSTGQNLPPIHPSLLTTHALPSPLLP